MPNDLDVASFLDVTRRQITSELSPFLRNLWTFGNNRRRLVSVRSSQNGSKSAASPKGWQSPLAREAWI